MTVTPITTTVTQVTGYVIELSTVEAINVDIYFDEVGVSADSYPTTAALAQNLSDALDVEM